MSEPDPVDLERIKVEILLDSPLVRRVEEAAGNATASPAGPYCPRSAAPGAAGAGAMTR